MPGCAMRISNERGDKWVWLSFHGVAPASAEPEDLWGTPPLRSQWDLGAGVHTGCYTAVHN